LKNFQGNHPKSILFKGSYYPNLATYFADLPGNTVEDFADLSLKNTCPTNRYASLSSDDNLLVVRGCIELPQNQASYGPGADVIPI